MGATLILTQKLAWAEDGAFPMRSTGGTLLACRTGPCDGMDSLPFSSVLCDLLRIMATIKYWCITFEHSGVLIPGPGSENKTVEQTDSLSLEISAQRTEQSRKGNAILPQNRSQLSTLSLRSAQVTTCVDRKLEQRMGRVLWE